MSFRVLGPEDRRAGVSRRRTEGRAARASAAATHRQRARPISWAIAFGVAAIVGHVRPIFLSAEGQGRESQPPAAFSSRWRRMPMLMAFFLFVAVVSSRGYVALGSLVAPRRCLPSVLVTRGARVPLASDRCASGSSSSGLIAETSAVCGAARSIDSASGGTRDDGTVTRCAVIGAGAWGTALADLLARNGHDGHASGRTNGMWSRRSSATHENRAFPRRRISLPLRCAPQPTWTRRSSGAS